MRACLLMIVIFVVCVGLNPVLAEPGYVGAAKCKMCHKTEYASWQSLSHSKAFESIKEEDRAKPECLKCHATGGSADMPGVQCEACHGPGSGYKSLKVMKDHDASVAAGLALPDEALCKSCHEGAPHDQAPFDYETAKAKGQHEVKNPG